MKSCIAVFLTIGMSFVAPGCGPSDAVSIVGISTTTTGLPLISYADEQSRPFADDPGYTYRSYLVYPDGRKEGVIPPPPTLRSDCSDSPPAQGLCIPYTYDASEGHYLAVFPDGSYIGLSDRAPNKLIRFASSGAVIWTRDQIDRPMDAVRGQKILVVTSDNNPAAEQLDADSGEVLWTVQTPGRL